MLCHDEWASIFFVGVELQTFGPFLQKMGVALGSPSRGFCEVKVTTALFHG